MMKKLLLAIMAIFVFAMCIAGCGTSPKEEAQAFNEKFFKEEFQNKYGKEFNEAMNKYFEQYGETREADIALASNFPYAEKLNAIITNAQNTKIENKEVEPLKAKFIVVLQNQIYLLDLLKQNETTGNETVFQKMPQSIFDYKNEYAKITTGQGLPVMNTNIGQLYAHVASDVSFAVTNVSESDYIGNGYFGKQPQGKFILVKVISFNNQKDAVTIDSNLFKLINANNQEYSTSVEGMTAMNLSNGNAEGFLQQVNPGMSIEATYVFDVPANSKIADYKLQAHGGMTGDKVTMPLKVERTGY